MGLLSYFKKDASLGRRRERSRAKLSNMYYQQADRMAAAESAYELAKAGDREAVEVLLVRFEHLCPSTTVDREEKEHVVDLLVALGDQAEPVLVEYCLKLRKPIYWPLRVLERLWPEAKVTAFIVQILEATDTEYWRDPEKKIGLVQIAATREDPRIAAALLPFIGDQLEEVRFKAVDALATRGGDFAHPFLERIGEEESLRVLSRLAEAFVDHGWTIGETSGELAARLPRGFRLVNDRIQRT